MALSGNTSIDDQTGLATKVELSFSCTDLLDMDVFSKSDPFIIMYMNTGYTSRSNAGWIKVGRTEVIYDNLNPKVLDVFSLMRIRGGVRYHFGKFYYVYISSLQRRLLWIIILRRCKVLK